MATNDKIPDDLPGSAQQKLEAFIASSRRDCERSGTTWESLRWPGIKFTKLGSPKNARGKVAPEHLLEPGFTEFVKAYLWYSAIHHPKVSLDHLYLAFRVLEKALLSLHERADIWRCSVQVLDAANVVIRDFYDVTKTTASIAANRIEKIAAFLDERGLVESSVFGWRSSIKEPERNRSKIGQHAEQYRQSKLPDEEALDAVAEIFASDPKLPRDILTTSFIAMAMCAPSRGGEILELPVWAGLRELDQAGIERYGWRFFAFKGYQGDIKWIPSSMEHIGETAFERVRALTEPARAFAKWVEDHPEEFYRHDKCPDVDEDQPLTMIEAALALGFKADNRQQAFTGLHNRKLPTCDGANSLRTLWIHVKGRLPKGFPWLDSEKRGKFSEALFCMLRNQAHASRATIPVELQRLEVGFFHADLDPRTEVKYHQSLFDRHGYTGSDGRLLKLNTHQPRHFLNTVAQRAGLSQEYIAKWSGRLNPRHNRTYNHATDAEVLEKISGNIIASDAPKPTKLMGLALNPIKSDEFLGVITPAMHVTEAGYCVHNWIISPCLKYRDCGNCEDQVCVKGEAEKLQRLRARLNKLETVLALAIAEADEETIGADRWIAHHQQEIERLRQLIHMLTDDALPDGALVRLQGHGYSHVQRSLDNSQLGKGGALNGKASIAKGY